ncbi:Gfo/Idh/MocA family oxidoreductase [Lichenihabitans sp. PAMC28606]|uniref:Gfo/Idh/MocA family protein n=1 Tax=Lichenihabitans sp. PAMC28606 TaxID=2880932 RepID=UPI001D0A3233|nr:Gfo/Idh/MocA family oxidoreductase [Lichenihabitans sp. PAMC28606]UDL94412.1 Gfo/Idh/MocA family oxidoreductase [Lichenihabitans sp. PAMC28606]
MTEFTNPAAEPGRIRVGLVGVGNWAQHGHLRVLDLLPGYEIVAVQARRREVAEDAARRFGIPHVVDSVAELVALSDVDMVLVLNTAPQHADTVRAAIAAGKHVYCEWPLTISSAVAEDLARLARDAGVRHVVGLQRRLAPHTLYIRDLIRDGYVGNLRSVRMHVSMNYFQALRSQALAWTAPPENFSSVVAIYAGHFLDMLFHAVGRPTSLSALLVNQFPTVTIRETGETIATTAPDQLVLAGTLSGTAVLSVHIEGGKRNGSGVQIDITGDQGDLRITNRSAFGSVGDDYVVEGAHGDNLPLAVLPVPEPGEGLPPSDLPSAVLELAHLYAAFARDIATGTQTAPTFDDAVWLHDLFDRFDASSRQGVRETVA